MIVMPACKIHLEEGMNQAAKSQQLWYCILNLEHVKASGYQNQTHSGVRFSNLTLYLTLENLERLPTFLNLQWAFQPLLDSSDTMSPCLSMAEESCWQELQPFWSVTLSQTKYCLEPGAPSYIQFEFCR